jgi:hypothetical protein
MRWRANAYAIGPVVPSETFRYYQLDAGRCAATVAPGHGAGAASTPTRLERSVPFYRDVLSSVRGRWSQHRVSPGMATNVVTPTHASTASRKSGLLP